jgi:hypothetical protein
MLVRAIKSHGHFRWKKHDVFLSEVLWGERVGLLPVDEGCYTVYFAHMPLALFDGRSGKNKNFLIRKKCRGCPRSEMSAKCPAVQRNEMSHDCRHIIFTSVHCRRYPSAYAQWKKVVERGFTDF